MAYVEGGGLGGAKKKPLSAVEKAQRLREEKERRAKREREEREKRVAAAITLQNVDDKTVFAELSKLKAVTPAAVASAFNIKVSAAEDLLEDWEKRGLLVPVAKCERLKIYKPNLAAPPA